jgi:hypothetical protein
MTVHEQNRLDALKREVEIYKQRALEAERKCAAWRAETVNRAWSEYNEDHAA